MSADGQEVRPSGSTTAFTRDQLARLAFVVFYSPVLCAPQNIKAVADEIDCCPGCDHVSNGGTCIVSERGDYCPNDLAETLRQISVALYGPGAPSHYVENVFGPDQMPALAPSPDMREAVEAAWKRILDTGVDGLITDKRFGDNIYFSCLLGDLRALDAALRSLTGVTS